MNITDSVIYIGVNDREIDLFEGQYIVPNGIAYNSYAIIDEKIAIMDSVDANFTGEWLDNIKNALGDRKPDYLVVQHMEPDHSANIDNFLKAYPEAQVVSTKIAFQMMNQFFGTDYADRRIVAGEGRDGDIELLEELGEMISAMALCGLGKTAAGPVLSTIKYFRKEYEAHIYEKRCPAGACQKLKQIVIDPALCKGCSKCAKNCPVGAISGKVKEPFTIDTTKCIKCDACRDNCAFGAVYVEA